MFYLGYLSYLTSRNSLCSQILILYLLYVLIFFSQFVAFSPLLTLCPLMNQRFYFNVAEGIYLCFYVLSLISMTEKKNP